MNFETGRDGRRDRFVAWRRPCQLSQGGAMSCDISINVTGSSVYINCESPCPTGSEPVPGVVTYVEDIGDGTATSFLITHSLGTSDVLVSVRSNPSGVVGQGDPVVAILGPDQLSVGFAAPPAAGEYRVLVLAAK